MAYSSIGTPVFYIDNYLYLRTIGANPHLMTSINVSGTDVGVHSPYYKNSTFTLKPSNATELYEGSSNLKFIHIPSANQQITTSGNIKWYFALLNHNFAEKGIAFGKINKDGTNPTTIAVNDAIYNSTTTSSVGNLTEDDEVSSTIPKNGSSIFAISSEPYSSSDTTEIMIRILTEGEDLFVGAISAGFQYTMPHSPDLRLSMNIEMDGINTVRTSNGGSISNIQHIGNPLWYNGNNIANPFEAYGSEGLNVLESGAIRNGRMSWDLKFSYINDYDLFPANQRASNYTEHPTGEYQEGDIYNENNFNQDISEDDSFISQVWNKTLGGGLPFIFQPDSNNRDNFYICKFDQKSLRVNQLAHKAYRLSVKIVETW